MLRSPEPVMWLMPCTSACGTVSGSSPRATSVDSGSGGTNAAATKPSVQVYTKQ